MSTPPAQTLDLIGVLSESKRIINAHSRHFLALSVFFLLPLSFSLIIYPSFQSTLSQSDTTNTQILLSLTYTLPPTKSLLFPLLYFLFIFILSLCALATITYSTFHAFYGRPVKLLSSVKSLLYSFIPLLSTTLASLLLLFLISLVFILFFAFATKTLQALAFQIDFNSNFFIAVSVVLVMLLASVLVCFQVNWALACVIVVAESKWGFQPLWRSAYLLKGMKSVSLSLMLFFGVSVGFFVWVNSISVVSLVGVSGWRSWAFILQTVLSSSVVTLFMLHNAAATTVLYMYCKALHGELAFEIAEEFAREYVSLPFDDEKVPHVVSVVHA